MRRYRRTCNNDNRTITQVDYSDPGPVVIQRHISDGHIETDLIINRHNLYIDPIPVAPSTNPQYNFTEKYTDFARKYINIYPNLYDQNAFNDDVLIRRAKWIQDNQNRTNYQITHCRRKDGIVSTQTIKRAGATVEILPKHWLIDSTYQASYRTPEQYAKVGIVIPKQHSYKSQLLSVAKDKAQDVLRETFWIQETAYGNHYCEPIEQCIARGLYGKTGPSPIDRHTKIK